MPDGSRMLRGQTLTRRQKAAIVVQVLLSEGQPLDLSELPEDHQLALTRDLGTIGAIDRTTVDAIIAEFVDELEQTGLSGPGGVSAALAALSGALSPNVSTRLKNEISGGDPWQAILGLTSDELLPLMSLESHEVAAITLSKLPVPKAAELLGKLPGDQARRITYSMSLTAQVRPEIVRQIGATLSSDYVERRQASSLHPPPQRLGAILTLAQTATRDSLLADLGAEDTKFAEDVRRAIFTFADLPKRVSAPDVPKVIRAVDTATLTVALAHAAAIGGPLAAAADYLLANTSQRMASALRDEVESLPKPKAADGEAAQAEVIAAIRALADDGTITLFSAEDEET